MNGVRSRIASQREYELMLASALGPEPRRDAGRIRPKSASLPRRHAPASQTHPANRTALHAPPQPQKKASGTVRHRSIWSSSVAPGISEPGRPAIAAEAVNARRRAIDRQAATQVRQDLLPTASAPSNNAARHA